MVTLDIVALRSFDAVVAFSGVRRAAQALHLSQGAVSGHLRRLERELGCTLVMRHGRGITLTGDGDELAARARLLLQQHDETVQAMLPAGEGELVMAATEHAAEALVPTLVTTLKKVMPNVTVRLRLTRSVRARELLHESRADIALTLTSPPRRSDEVATLPLEWLGSGDAPIDRLVLFEPPCAVRHQAVAALQGANFAVIRECSNLTSVIAAARRGEGVTPLPRFGPRPDALDPIKSLPAIPNVPLYLATGPRVPGIARSALIRSIRETLGSVAAS